MHDVLDDEDALVRLRAAATGAQAPLAEILDRFELIVTPPLTGDGAPALALLCRREHPGEFTDDPGGPTVLIPTTFAPRDDPDAATRAPLERLLHQATQKGMTLADLVEHALEHEDDAHG